MNKFRMAELHDAPIHELIPDNIRFLHNESKTEIYDGIMDEIITELFIPYEMQVCMHISVRKTN